MRELRPVHAEDLALRKGEVVAVAAVGQHPSGWWEGFTKGGRYGLVPKHGIEPLFDNESSESIGLGMMADIPPDWRPVTRTPPTHAQPAAKSCVGLGALIQGGVGHR